MPILLELVRATSDTVWHGMNEPGFHMPIRSFSHLLRRAIPLLSLLALPLAAQESPQRQSGIVVEATAADAVQARDRALAQGRREAYNRMAAATGAPAATASDAQIEAMIASIIIEQERVTSTRYTGRITVVFNGASGSTPPAQPNPMAAAPAAGQPASSFIEVRASVGSLQQWMTLQRQMLRAGPVASLDIIAISTDAARLRLGLRVPQGDAPSALLSSGVVLTPPARPGDIWRVGLGDG